MAKTVKGWDGKIYDIWTSSDVTDDCPMCGAHAIVELTPRLKAKQTDGTTYVCHPGFKGCNQGFKRE